MNPVLAQRKVQASRRPPTASREHVISLILPNQTEKKWTEVETWKTLGKKGLRRCFMDLNHKSTNQCVIGYKWIWSILSQAKVTKSTWHVITLLRDARLFLGSAHQNVPAADFMQLRLPRKKTRYICENLEESQKRLEYARVHLPPNAWQQAKNVTDETVQAAAACALGLGPSKNAGIGPFSQAPMAAL